MGQTLSEEARPPSKEEITADLVTNAKLPFPNLPSS